VTLIWYRTVLRQSCEVFSSNLRICDLRINRENLRIWDFRTGKQNFFLRICDSEMSRGIGGFAICGLKSKVYLWLLYCTKGKKYINVSTCSDSFYFERSRIHLSVIARKKGGRGPVTEKICTQAAGLYINILYARAKNQPSHWEKMQSHVGDIAPMIWQHSLHIREYWMINRGTGFLAVVGFGFSTITHPPPLCSQ
jgi:hypothetical protein